MTSTRARVRLTRWLLAGGVVGPLLFIVVFLVEGATRPGYSVWRNFVSELALSDQGWEQIANFIVCGLLCVTFAIGLRRTWRTGKASVWGPLLMALFGLSLVVAGVFVTDPALQASLRLDISSANHDLANAEWKSATVLAASVVESLLLWSLTQRPTANIIAAIAALAARPVPFHCPDPPLDRPAWTLRPYIEVAAELKIITERTAIQARQAADYRNLIHPGRAQRLAQHCSRGTALAAVAALELVVSDLTPPPGPRDG